VIRQFQTMILGTTLALSALAFTLPARADDMRDEMREHPRIVKAIHELQDAVKYMEEAPHDFGGHKAEAIEASRRAIEQLRKALRYRARHEHDGDRREGDRR
jgi:hypothetical protein